VKYFFHHCTNTVAILKSASCWGHCQWRLPRRGTAASCRPRGRSTAEASPMGWLQWALDQVPHVLLNQRNSV